jgi:inorganic pyrophosphatase
MITDMIVEIPYQSAIKYEYDEISNKMRCDRILHTAMAYPGNYGYFPNTLSGDGDPLDVLLISDYAIYPGTIINVKIIGVLQTEDEKGQDEKIIAVPTENIDPSYKNINDIKDLPVYTCNKIRHFFEHYKDMEPNKWVKIQNFEDSKKAEEIYKKSLQIN